MEALVDTNILVYRYDGRYPAKQRIAHDFLRQGAEHFSVALPHQAIVEFVAATTRPRRDLGGRPILSCEEAYREAEEMLSQFIVLFPDDEVILGALRGAALYRMSWFDAHIWAYAERFGIPEIYSEDFQSGRLYGSVRVVNPFADLENVVHEDFNPYQTTPTGNEEP